MTDRIEMSITRYLECAPATCKKCALHRREDCIGGSDICEDYEPSPDFSKEECERMKGLKGSVTAIRYGESYHDGYDSNGYL